MHKPFHNVSRVGVKPAVNLMTTTASTVKRYNLKVFLSIAACLNLVWSSF